MKLQFERDPGYIDKNGLKWTIENRTLPIAVAWLDEEKPGKQLWAAHMVGIEGTVFVFGRDRIIELVEEHLARYAAMLGEDS